MPAALNSESRDDVVYVRSPSGPDVIPELSTVILTAPVRSADDVSFPAGTVGAIVAVWDDGSAYEVEFPEPVGALATVRKDQLRRVDTSA